MANVFRLIRGNTKPLSLPGYSSDAVEIGDLMFWDATNNAARPASNVSGAAYADKKTNLAAKFLGVAMEAKDANVSGNVLIATDGDYLLTAPSGGGTDAEPLDFVAGGDGTSMLDQTVVKTATNTDAVARVIAVKTTSESAVQVRLLSAAHRI